MSENEQTTQDQAKTENQDPTTKHPRISPPEQLQQEPGSDRDLIPQADHGEASYVGRGRLKGKRVLITGADSGIGAAVAIAFAKEGAAVGMSYLPDEEEDARHVQAVGRQVGAEMVLLPGDLRDAGYRGTLVNDSVECLGGLDVLVNCAGKQVAVGELEDLSDEQVRATFDVNVLAMYSLCRDALRVLRPGGSIINTTSIQAYSPSSHLLDYAPTKAAINAFTKALAEQQGERGIRVNAVAPGPIWTPLQPSHGQFPEALPEFGHNTWLGRAGQPVEVAPAYVFLASDDASFVTGSTVHVNGGEPTP